MIEHAPLMIAWACTTAVFLWIQYGFDYSGDWNMTGLLTLPLGIFLTMGIWLVYFICKSYGVFA